MRGTLIDLGLSVNQGSALGHKVTLVNMNVTFELANYHGVTTMQEHTTFGQLRSWMNQAHLDVTERQQLWEAIQQCATRDASLYEEQWRPYLRNFPHHFEGSLAMVYSLESLSGGLELVPFARFSLTMEDLDMGDHGVRNVVHTRDLASVVYLNLGSNYISASGARTVAESPYLSSLEVLDLRFNEIRDEGAKAIATSPFLPSLASIDLSHNDISQWGAEAIANSRHSASLRELNLANNWVGDEGAQALSDSPHLAGLNVLNLRNNNLGDEGARALASSPYLKDRIRRRYDHE